MRIANTMSMATRRWFGRAACLMAAGLTLGVGSAKAQETIFGLTTTNALISFSSATPGTLLTNAAITGLASGDTLLGIDFRPAIGTLYAVGRLGNLYTINTANSQASLVAALFANPMDPTDPFTALNGAAFGVDFNPVVDALRVVSTSGQNLRINPSTGATFTDTNLLNADGTSPFVGGSAYTNNVAGAASTVLYGIDARMDRLVIQSPPNEGVLNPVGALGVDVNAELLGFDISGVTGTAFASLASQTGNTSSLYTINLGTGAATLVGGIGSGLAIRGIAVTPAVIPEPGTFALLGTSVLGFVLIGGASRVARRRKTAV